jgi:hypothetical protein
MIYDGGDDGGVVVHALFRGILYTRTLSPLWRQIPLLIRFVRFDSRFARRRSSLGDGPETNRFSFLTFHFFFVAVTMTTCVAASPPLKLSLEQVRDVSDSIKKPLTGQQVLIPLGSKAFLPGTLRPSVSSDGEEQVVVRDQDGKDEEMTRRQVLDSLQVEMDALKPPSRNSKAVNIKSALRKSKLSSTTALKPTHTPMNPSMPYFEIREEYNDAGKQITGQATNVSKQLEYLQKQTAGESVVHVPPESKDDEAPDDYDDGETWEEVRVEDLKPVNEEGYSNLSTRLEELERLEEKANNQQEGNSKIKSMRKGWSKGFLNTKKPAKKPAPAPTKSISIQKPAPARKPAPPSVPTQKSAPATTNAPTTERRVNFQGEDQVKEIPRVGERSVSDVRKPAARKQIEESVFNGVVKERATAPSAARQEEPAPKKKLSRFAQQRQDEMG